MNRLALVLLALPALPAVATAQPYSESAADCAAVYQNAAQWVETDASAEKLMVAARIFVDAAVTQADREGRRLNTDAAWTLVDGKTAEWEAKGAAVVFTKEFRDWTSYCRSFAGHLGIDIDP